MAQEEWFLTAQLASLELDEGEALQLAQEAEKMKDLFLTMSRADVENLEPTTHTLITGNRVRPDAEKTFNRIEELLDAAPEREDEYILIPNVL